ncbi:extracellular solute-binding protein [Eubacteriales bacterium OttesenSCG-928-N13]|nr:extracellular solute-binding protein [Eubacteriales bacterium OttesenSCG-928-N13]
MSTKRAGRRMLVLLLGLCLIAGMLSGCGSGGVKLDPKNPTTVRIWNYYTGAIANAFDDMVSEFNTTVGAERGIIVESSSLGSIPELENAVKASINKEVGSETLPSIFASYADVALLAEKAELLVNLDNYLTKEDQDEYIASFIDEGRIGLKGELRIFPIAKSTEMFMLNKTDWAPFANECGFTLDDLATTKGLVEVAKRYYEWTDAQTPDVANDGKAFYGRDSIANMMILRAKEYGHPMFIVDGVNATLDLDRETMKSIWDNYYVSFISGYYAAYGRYRSDDVKIGRSLAYIGSTSSASYFPTEIVADDGSTHNVEVAVLPIPYVEGKEKHLIQQGAGMVVTKTNDKEEYASVEFLKWFTNTQNNIVFSSASAYIPVKKEAANYDNIKKQLEKNEQTMSPIADETLRAALVEMSESTLYANKPFDGGVEARDVLDESLAKWATTDREAVVALIESGTSHADAVAQFANDEHFDAWLAELEAQLTAALA